MVALTVSDITCRTSGARHYINISFYRSCSLCFLVFEYISGSCFCAEISCHIRIKVLSQGCLFGRSRSLDARAYDSGVNYFSIVDLGDS